jgi:hypothetical protein
MDARARQLQTSAERQQQRRYAQAEYLDQHVLQAMDPTLTFVLGWSSQVEREINIHSSLVHPHIIDFVSVALGHGAIPTGSQWRQLWVGAGSATTNLCRTMPITGTAQGRCTRWIFVLSESSKFNDVYIFAFAATCPAA